MMKRYFRIFPLALSVFALSAGASAQTTYSGYFLDDYNYRFQMNPALGNETSFVSMPALGNINFNLIGNLNVKDVVYSVDGRSVLFTNPAVSVAEAMSRFKKHNRVMTSDKIDIMSGGFKAFGGYNTVSLGVVANAGVSVPKSFFSLAKEGVTNSVYEIEDMKASGNAYFQLAFGHSRDIKEVKGLRVGAAVKFLVGVCNVDMKFNEATLALGEDNWTARTNAEVYTSMKGFRYKTEHSDRTGEDYVSGGDPGNFSPTGFGLGFDLGAEYEWNDFRFTASVLDLGFITWGHTRKASTPGTREVQTDAFHFNVDNDAPNSFNNEWDRLTADVARLYQMTEIERVPSYTRALGATVNLGAEQPLPSYRQLRFGLLSTTRIDGKYTWTRFRFSANISPVEWFSGDVNVSVGSYGAGFGWLLNFHTKYFNLFAGMDQTFGKLSKQYIPLNSNASFNFGLNFPF